MHAAPTRFAQSSALTPRQRWALVMAILLFHALLGLALIRAFGGVRALAEQVGLGPVLVEIAPPEAPKHRATAVALSNEGTSGASARKASADALSSPNPLPFPVPTVAPVSGQGNALQSGASASGQGTGGAGSGTGTGTGSGDTGNGSGGRVIASKPEKIAGDIAERDYPKEGRATRLGKAVIVILTVGTDGHVSDCAIHQSSGDPDADAITCKLATERFRFHPALDQNGDPIAAPYGWKQAFFWHDPGQ